MIFNIFSRKIGCRKAFTDWECQDQYQFWFCGLLDDEDNQIHYCDVCTRRKIKRDAKRSETAP